MTELISRGQFNESLISRVANKDYSALKEIYESSSSIIYGLALSITRNKEDSEDILQETYIKLFEKAYTYIPEGKPLAWLCTITKNLSLMKLRSKKKIDDYDISNNIDYSCIHNIDDKIILESAFKILGSEELQIVLLYSTSGFKHKEIAEILNIPLSTVLSKYNRALKKMRNHIEKGGKK